MVALVVGVISKKYLWKTNTSPRSSTSIVGYPDSGDLLTELRDKWKRPVEALPVHVDIPRLARKITIYTATSQDSTKHPVLATTHDDLAASGDHPPTNDNQVIREVIRTLSKHLGEPENQQEKIDTRFPEYFKRTADPSLALQDFMSDVVGHDSLTLGVLKACNQSVLAPGVLVCPFLFIYYTFYYLFNMPYFPPFPSLMPFIILPRSLFFVFTYI